MIDSPKKLVTKLVKGSAAAAVIGVAVLSNLVQAEDKVAEEVTVPTEPVGVSEAPAATGPQTVSEAEAVVAVAQAEVSLAAQAVAAAEAAVTEQTAQVATGQAAELVATETLVAAERAQAEAEKLAAEATPEKIAQIQAQVTAKTAELAAAQTKEQADKMALAAAETALAGAQAKVATAQTALTSAQAAQSAVEARIEAPTKLTADKAAAEQSVADLTTQLATAKSDLAVITSNAATAIASDITAKQAEIARLEAEITRLSNETTTVTTGSTTDVMGGNSFNAQGYPAALLEEFKATNNRAVVAPILAATASHYATNQYKSIPADNYSINTANLTADQQNEIALFSANLINDVRRTVGLKDIEVVVGAQQFADGLATRYRAAHLGQYPSSFGYHDLALIREVAPNYGLQPAERYYYEALGNDRGAITTMNRLKQTVYNTLSYFLFADSYAAAPLGHTVNLLRGGASDTVYLGVDTTDVGDYTIHFMVVEPSTIRDASKFDVTSLSKVGTVEVKVDNSVQIAALQGQVTGLAGELTNLEAYRANPASYPSIVAAQAKIDDLSNKLTVAQARVSALETALAKVVATNAQVAQELVAAKAAVATAQSRLSVAQAALSQETAALEVARAAASGAGQVSAGLKSELDALTALLAQYQNPNLVSDAQAAVEAARSAQTSAQEQVATAVQKLQTLQAALATAQTALTAKETNLAEAQAVLAALIEEMTGLVVKQDANGVTAVLAENLTEDEKPVFEVAPEAPKPVTPAPAALSKTSTRPVVAKAQQARTAQATKGLPKTGDQPSVVAAVLAGLLLSGAVLAAYQARRD